jgi:hypothetical protein
MTIVKLINQLRQQGVSLQVVGSQLKCDLPAAGIEPSLKAALIANKEPIMRFIARQAEVVHKVSATPTIAARNRCKRRSLLPSSGYGLLTNLMAIAVITISRFL